MQAIGVGDLRPWEVSVLHDVWNPGGVAVLPHAPRKTDPRREPHLLAYRFEVRERQARLVPSLNTRENTGIARHFPQSAVRPAEALADGSQDPWRSVRQCRRVSQGQSDGVLRAQATLRHGFRCHLDDSVPES